MTEAFVAFIPLSNWLRGFDRYAMAYSKRAIVESTWPDAFYLLREDEPWEVGLGKSRRLIAKLGRANDRVVALRAALPVGEGGISRNDVTGTGVGWRWPSPTVPLSGVAWVDERGALQPTHHEEITAQAFCLGDDSLTSWAACRPRSFSVLPVVRACQARCAFCFSKASVSELARQPTLTLATVAAWARRSRARGAERAVITGGGEPTLLPRETLRGLVATLATQFPTTLLITNGAVLDLGRLTELRAAGLTTLGVSRHGLTPDGDERVMGLRVDAGLLARAGRELGLRTRAICVLQRGGVEDARGVTAYLERSAAEGFAEVCFKELYVSSLSENRWAGSAVNAYARTHQVPLKVVLEGLDGLGFVRTASLPWGSPVFEGTVRGRTMRVAAYTEPSVGWERSHGLARSWNLMADGACVASLEDPGSVLEREEAVS
jgi:hypothetical protein